MSSRIDVELRSARLDGNTLTGYASVFDQATRIGNHYERIARTAFDEALERSDVRFFYNHDKSLLLGRQSSGTLRLWTDDHGLGFEVDLPDTQAGRDVRELVARGDLDGASFAFVPGDDEWGTAPDGRQVRTHTRVRELIDASVVSFPAYEGTTVSLREADIRPGDRLTVNKARLIKARHKHRSSTE